MRVIELGFNMDMSHRYLLYITLNPQLTNSAIWHRSWEVCVDGVRLQLCGWFSKVALGSIPQVSKGG
jgi:hypothetical protein